MQPLTSSSPRTTGADTFATAVTTPPSATRNKPRSSSSPVMKTPPKVPPLNLPSSTTSTFTGHSAPVTASPRHSVRVRFIEPAATGGSQSAPTTPRKSPRPAQREHPSGKQVISPRRPVSDAGGDIVPSPRKVSTRLIALGEQAAGRIFGALVKVKPLLDKATIDELCRFEIPVPVNTLGNDLLALLSLPPEAQFVSHAKLIRTLFLPAVEDSAAGKTLRAMRTAVMADYDGQTLTIAQRVEYEQADSGFLQRMLQNVEAHGVSCAEVALGLGQPSLAASGFPAELIAFWKAMDRHLIDWAGGNPSLPDDQLETARANLGFDILFTRLLLPMISGSQDEAMLAIPSIFFKSVKDAVLQRWPAFVDSFIATVDRERQRASSAATTATTTTTTTTTASTGDRS